MSRTLGVDLGTSTILVYAPRKGIAIREPSVIAVEREGGKILALGAQAEAMLGRTPDGITAAQPVRAGAVADYALYAAMLSGFVQKLCRHRLTKPDLLLAVPASITKLEEHAVLEAAAQAGARRVQLVESVLAAAVGAQVDFSRPEGKMVVDIGGGTTDIGVLSLGAVVVRESVRVGGESFDEALARYVRAQKKLLIGAKLASDAKIQVGCICPRPEEKSIRLRGRDLGGSAVGECELRSGQCIRPFAEPGGRIAEGIAAVLEKTPPELAADISKNGIVLTGGGSLLWGMDEFILRATGIRARLADDPASCVALGLGKLAETR